MTDNVNKNNQKSEFLNNAYNVASYIESGIVKGAVIAGELVAEYGPVVALFTFNCAVTCMRAVLKHGPTVASYIESGIAQGAKAIYDFAVHFESLYLSDSTIQDANYSMAKAVNGESLGYISYCYDKAAAQAAEVIEYFEPEINTANEALSSAIENVAGFSDQAYESTVEALNSTEYEYSPSEHLMLDVVGDF